MSDELITEARWRAAELAVKPDTGYGWATEEELMSMLANDLEAAEARVKELEAQAKDHKAEQVFRISELQELGEAQARIAELEAGEISALREARAETWDEAISAVFAWWSAPPEQRQAGIVNPYGVGMPVESEGTDD